MSNELGKIAYILHEFPKLSETFISREILALKKRKVDLEVISMKSTKEFISSELEHIVKDTIYVPPLFSMKFIVIHLYFLLKSPRGYLMTCFYLLMQKHRNIRVFLRSLYHFGVAIYLCNILKAKGIKHIHAHFASGPTTVALIISRILNIPFSFTAHAIDIYADPIMLQEKLKKAKFIVTCTQFNKRYLLSIVRDISQEKIDVVYHGIPIDKFDNNGNGRRENNELLILSVGRLVEKKGFPYLIEACRILNEKGYKFKCIIVGDGVNYGELSKRIEEHNLDKIIILTKALPFDEVMKLYKKANIFVLPCVIAVDNDRDGIPNTLLEAIAFNLPVISTRISGIPEVIEDMKTGLLVKERDNEGLAEAIERLMKDETLRAKLAKNGRAEVIKKFDIEETTTKLINLFRQEI